MTRKDYELIAKAINDTHDRIRANPALPDGEMVSQLRGVRRTAAHIANALSKTKPRFDAQRFLTACGYGA